MVPVALIFAVGALVLAVVFLSLARSASLEYDDARERLLLPGSETLAYDVPNGQDPAVVMTALHRAGYASVEDSIRTTRRVLVACPSGRFRDRSGVRMAIESVDDRPADVPVRFVDEPEGIAS